MPETMDLPGCRRTFVCSNSRSWRTRLKARGATIVHRRDLRGVLREGRKTDLWIVGPAAANGILDSIEWKNVPRCGDALVLGDVRSSALEALYACFNTVALCGTHGAVLPPEELAEAMSSQNRKDLAVQGTIDDESRTLTLWRGDLSKLVVPLSAFERASDVETPDFGDFAITDCGQTLRFGRYEAAFDSLLYEFDPHYRRELQKKRQKSQQGFGASLRRLRKQRRLSRDGFPPLPAKTIARIERGEVAKPRGRTLGILAKRLGVDQEEIGSF